MIVSGGPTASVVAYHAPGQKGDGTGPLNALLTA